MGTPVSSAKRGRMWSRMVVVLVVAVLGDAAPQVSLPATYTHTTDTSTGAGRLGARQRDLVQPGGVHPAAFPPPLPQGARSGQVLLQPESTESLETNQHGHGGVELDSLESGAYSLAVALGNTVPSASRGAATPDGTQISRSSQFLTFGDADNSLDIIDSLEDDDDDFRFKTLGRRYHPEGVAPLAPKDLFIPPVAPLPVQSAPAAPKSFAHPFFHNLAESAEDDVSGEDLSEVNFGYNIPSSAVAFIRGEASSEERIQLDETLLSNRYNFVDKQGSRVWGYQQEDQYQHQVVRQDGTMEGTFGWTAPNGHQVSIEYVADKGGYRVLSSHGIHIKNPEVEKLNREHAKAHQEVTSTIARGGEHFGPVSGGGVPLPSPTGPGSHSQGTFSSGGVPLPSPTGPGSHRQGTFSSGGVPLPSPTGPATGSGFFVDDDDAPVIVGGGGVPLPALGSGDTAVGDAGVGDSFRGGVPLPTPTYPGAPAATPGSDFSSGTGGVPLPSITSGSSGGASGFSEDDELSFLVGAGGGGVPLPSFGGAGATGSMSQGDFGGQDVGVGLGGGVPLPSPGPGLGGGVPLPSPGPGLGGGVPLPSSEPELGGGMPLPSPGPGLGGGVPLPSPGPGLGGGVPLPSPGPGLGGGVSLPSPGPGLGGGVSLPSPGPGLGGGVSLPSPGPGEISPTGMPGFFDEDEVPLMIGTEGGVPLPRPGSASPGSAGEEFGAGGGGVPLPGFATSSGQIDGGTDTGVGGGVPLPNPETTPGNLGVDSGAGTGVGFGGGVPLPGRFGSDFEAGVDGGVPLPGRDTTTGQFGADFGAGVGGGVSLPSPDTTPGQLGAEFGGGVPLPGPETTPGQFGADFGGGVPLPSPDTTPGQFGSDFDAGVGSGGDVPLPGPETTPDQFGSNFGAGVSVGSRGGVPLPGPETTTGQFGSNFGAGVSVGVPLPGPETTPGQVGADFGMGVGVGVGGGVPLPGAGTTPGQFGADFGTGVGAGVPLPGPETTTGRFGVDFNAGVGVGTSVVGGGGVPFPSPDTTPGQFDAGVGTGVGVGVPLPGAETTPGQFEAGVSVGVGGGVPLPGPETTTGQFGTDFGTGVGVGVPLSGAEITPGQVDAGVDVGGGVREGVPLPSPDTTLGQFGDDFGTGADFGQGVRLPGPEVSSGLPSGQADGTQFGVGGVPLPGASPTQFGQGFAESGTQMTGGVGLPTPIGAEVPFGGASQTASISGGAVGVPLPSPNFEEDTALSQRCLLAGKTSPSLLPPECQQISSSFGGGVPLPSMSDSPVSPQAGTEGSGPADTGIASATVGVPLPDFGGDPAFHGKPADPELSPSVSGVPFSGFGGAAGGVAGGPGDADFGSIQGGVPLPSFGGSGSEGVGLRGSGFSGAGIPLTNLGSRRNGGFDFEVDTSFNQGFGEESVGVPLATTGAVEVPLQGPPFPVGDAGVPLNNNFRDANRINPNDAAFPFFESGPPESILQATGGPNTHVPQIPVTALSTHSTPAQGPHYQVIHSVDQGIPLRDITGQSYTGMTRDIQDVAKAYHDIYGIKMRLESSSKSGQEMAAPMGVSLPTL